MAELEICQMIYLSSGQVEAKVYLSQQQMNFKIYFSVSKFISANLNNCYNTITYVALMHSMMML